MNNVQGNNDMKPMQPGRGGAERGSDDVGLRQRVDQARDMIDTVRDRADVILREKPYLLPVAAGAVGFGLGVLVSSKLTRFIAFTAVGTLLTDALGGEIKRIGKDFIEDLQGRIGAMDGDEV